MARVDTLTAYKCKFRYMQRNNPLIEEQREEIKSGNEPTLTFEDFISLYSENSDNFKLNHEQYHSQSQHFLLTKWCHSSLPT